MKKSRRLFVLVSYLLSITIYGHAQEKSQYRFAQTYFGATSTFSSNVFRSNSSNMVPSHFGQRLVLGGLHFWTKADFYVSFPIVSRAMSNHSSAQYSEGVVTGGRWIPLGLKNNGFRPYIGGAWLTPYLSTNKGGDEKHDILADLGLIYIFKKRWSFEMGVHRALFNEWKLNSGNTIETWYQPQLVFDFSIKKYFDFTAGLEREEAQKNIKVLEQKMLLNKDRSTWSVAIGMSSNIPLSTSMILKDADIQDLGSIGIMPEYGLGYYSHLADAACRISYRNTFSSAVKHGHFLQVQERRIGFEAFKFLFDYQGFVPFIGIGADLNFYEAEFALDNQNRLIESGKTISPSLVFGWDIRPSQVEWFVLRTSLRYKPQIGNHEFSNYQAASIEFNFIQMVVYPARLKYYFKK